MIELYTTTEVARILKVSDRAVRRMIQNGQASETKGRTLRAIQLKDGKRTFYGVPKNEVSKRKGRS